jgi:hypothetical protein
MPLRAAAVHCSEWDSGQIWWRPARTDWPRSNFSRVASEGLSADKQQVLALYCDKLCFTRFVCFTDVPRCHRLPCIPVRSFSDTPHAAPRYEGVDRQEESVNPNIIAFTGVGSVV